MGITGGLRCKRVRQQYKTGDRTSNSLESPRDTQFEEQAARRRRTLLGDKGVTIPFFPIVLHGKGAETITLQDWKAYTTGIRIWSSLESTNFANLVDIIYDSPNVIIDEKILDFLTKDKLDIDKTLGLHVYNGCPTSIKKLMTPRDQYELKRGHTSGLKILVHIGKKINRKTADRRQGLLTQLATRMPIEHVMDLKNELIEIQLLVDELEHQGLRYDAETLYGTLLRSVSILMGKTHAVLFRAVQHPIMLYKMKPYDEYKDGYKFMELLRQILDCVMQDSEYECMRTRKAKITAIAAAVSDDAKRKTPKRFTRTTRDTKSGQQSHKVDRPPGHIMNPPAGQPCVNERETGKCLLPNCKSTHNLKGCENTECKNPSYVALHVCPGFIPGRRSDGSFCKCKHSKNPNAKELAAKRQQAQRDFAEIWAICEACDSDFDKSEYEESDINSQPSTPRDDNLALMVTEVEDPALSCVSKLEEVRSAVQRSEPKKKYAERSYKDRQPRSANNVSTQGVNAGTEEASTPPTMAEIIAVAGVTAYMCGHQQRRPDPP